MLHSNWHLGKQRPWVSHNSFMQGLQCLREQGLPSKVLASQITVLSSSKVEKIPWAPGSCQENPFLPSVQPKGILVGVVKLVTVVKIEIDYG